jgi:hypothetical protein
VILLSFIPLDLRKNVHGIRNGGSFWWSVLQVGKIMKKSAKFCSKFLQKRMKPMKLLTGSSGTWGQRKGMKASWVRRDVYWENMCRDLLSVSFWIEINYHLMLLTR